MSTPTLSAVVSIHNEEERLATCLEKVAFADELVVILDNCTDRSREISEGFGAVISEGNWEREGDRRNAAIAACSCDWILEVDADEHVPLLREGATPTRCRKVPSRSTKGGRVAARGPNATLPLRITAFRRACPTDKGGMMSLREGSV